MQAKKGVNLITILRILEIEFFLYRLIDRIIVKKYCLKRTFRSDFVKLSSEILYFFLAEKFSFVVLFCCNALSDLLTFLD